MFCFNSDFAKKYGLHEAIVFEIIQELSNYSDVIYYNDKYWVQITGFIYNNHLRFLSLNEIEFAIKKLINLKFIKTMKINNKDYYCIIKKC